MFLMKIFAANSIIFICTFVGLAVIEKNFVFEGKLKNFLYTVCGISVLLILMLGVVCICKYLL